MNRIIKIILLYKEKEINKKEALSALYSNNITWEEYIGAIYMMAISRIIAEILKRTKLIE